MPDGSNQHFTTQDGSSSLISGKFGEAYHSKHGAIQESLHVFIDAGLTFQIQAGYKEIKILEIGFGTGLNAALTLVEANKHSNINISYEGIEAYPISSEEAKSLNYHKLIDLDKNSLLNLHECPWGVSNQLTENFSFTKHQSTFEEFDNYSAYDLIYFDAFAPSTQSHLWETPFLSTIYKACNQQAVLVTYCAKGSFKRALKACGFEIESPPGPAKKREMTRAKKVRLLANA